MHRFALISLGAALLAAPAIAQTVPAPAAPQTPAQTAAPATAPQMPAIPAATHGKSGCTGQKS